MFCVDVSDPGLTALVQSSCFDQQECYTPFSHITLPPFPNSLSSGCRDPLIVPCLTFPVPPSLAVNFIPHPPWSSESDPFLNLKSDPCSCWTCCLSTHKCIRLKANTFHKHF
uniref:Uncharacterized protein n=1 Tax=Cacopsylla melanoneura TaxID=428564 RepID=A0A8D9BWH2_9HEMI